MSAAFCSTTSRRTSRNHNLPRSIQLTISLVITVGVGDEMRVCLTSSLFLLFVFSLALSLAFSLATRFGILFKHKSAEVRLDYLRIECLLLKLAADSLFFFANKLSLMHNGIILLY